jgi:TPR repeat protein
MYQYGHGVPKNYQLAADWFRKAAEQGIAVAQRKHPVRAAVQAA